MRKCTPVNLLASWLAILCLQSFTTSEAPILNYIDQYKAIAISEMHRTGIPASITMAQAIVESRYGTSTLATKSNNHFGIKCKGGWEGKTFYFKDDDYRHGRLVKSCFRGYDDSVQSYYDHSDFLVENLEMNMPKEEVVQVASVQKAEVIVENTPTTYKPVLSPPKAFKIPTNYQRGAGNQRASIADERTFQDDVFQGGSSYLFEIVPNVERKDIKK